MDDHLRILEKGIKAIAVLGNGALQERERRRGEVDDGEEEDLHGGENRSGVGVELDVGFVGEAEYESVGAEQPCTQEQRAFLTAPKRCEFVRSGKGAIGMLEDVGDGEVVGENGIDERKGGGADGDEAGDSGAAC